MSAIIEKFPRSYLDEAFQGDWIPKTKNQNPAPVRKWVCSVPNPISKSFESTLVVEVKANTKSEARAELKKRVGRFLPTRRAGLIISQVQV